MTYVSFMMDHHNQIYESTTATGISSSNETNNEEINSFYFYEVSTSVYPNHHLHDHSFTFEI